MTIDHSELRRSFLPEHLRVLADNERQRRSDIAIFELGYLHDMGPGGPVERPWLGILLAGAAGPAAWDSLPRAFDVADAKGLVEWLVARLGDARLHYEPAAARPAVDHPGRTAAIVADAASGTRLELGRAGQIDHRYLAAADVRSKDLDVVFAEVDMQALASLVPARRHIDALERQPAVERDIAVVVPESCPAGQVEAAIRTAGGPLLREIRLFDRYQGPQVGPDEVSLAYRLRFEPGERPLPDAELDALEGAIVAALGRQFGARLRA